VQEWGSNARHRDQEAVVGDRRFVKSWNLLVVAGQIVLSMRTHRGRKDIRVVASPCLNMLSYIMLGVKNTVAPKK
jgi:hypothetical protein